MKDARIVLALGSNLGDRRAYLRQGLEALGERIAIGPVSRVVESPPWGPVDQPPFLNLVLSATTPWVPLELLDRMQEVEAQAGRLRALDQGPRTLDVDLIFYENLRLDGPRLTLPHPSWRERPFVADLLGDVGASDPDSGRPFDRNSDAALEARGLRVVKDFDPAATSHPAATSDPAAPSDPAASFVDPAATRTTPC